MARGSLLAAGLLGLLAGGCARVIDRPSSPLAPLRATPQSVALEIVSVRFAQGDDQLTAEVWDQIDEQQLPVDVRRRLAANGFRAGVISGRLPLPLESAIRLKEKAPDLEEQQTVSDVDESLDVRMHQRWVAPGRRFDYIVTGEETRHPQFAVLLRDEQGQVRGRTYPKAMGLLAATPRQAEQGEVRLDLVPELEHGEPARRYTAGEGMLKVEFGPPHEVFESLRFEAALASGEMLVVTGRHDMPGSLGYQFFTEKIGGKTRQKLVIIRLAQKPLDQQTAFDALLAEP